MIVSFRAAAQPPIRRGDRTLPARRRKMCGGGASDRLRSGLKAALQLGGEGHRLLPGGEVAALGKPVVVDELRIGLLGPALRRLVDLVGEGADGDRDLDAPRIEEAARREMRIVPIEPRRGDRGVGQPVQRDVVEDVVPRQALRLCRRRCGRSARSCGCRDRASRRQDRRASRRCRRASAAGCSSRSRSRARSCRSRRAGHRRAFRRATGRLGQAPPAASALAISAGTVAAMLVWMPRSPGGCCTAISSETALPQSPPCATYCV